MCVTAQVMARKLSQKRVISVVVGKECRAAGAPFAAAGCGIGTGARRGGGAGPGGTTGSKSGPPGHCWTGDNRTKRMRL